MKDTGRLAGIVFAAFAALVSVAACAPGAGSPPAVTSKAATGLAAPSGCKPVAFIGARGSGESESGYDGMGQEVDHMAQVIKSDLAAKGLDTAFTPVSYTAASVDLLRPNATVQSQLKAGNTRAAIEDWVHTSVDPYDASIDDGIKQAEEDAGAAVSQCPSVKLIMGGYSQGAIAVHDAEVWLAANKPAVFQHVAGTLLLADPDRMPNTKAKNFGDPPAAPGGEGVRTWLRTLAGPPTPTRTMPRSLTERWSTSRNSRRRPTGWPPSSRRPREAEPLLTAGDAAEHGQALMDLGRGPGRVAEHEARLARRLPVPG